jgi:hypothetical protein
MSIIGFRVPIAISAAGLAAVGAAFVALSPPIAHADGPWAACAAPASTGQRAICASYPYLDSQAAAETSALNECNYPTATHRRCAVVVSYMQCVAVARNESQWVGGRGPTQDLAEQDALRSIDNGTIAKSVCVTPG